jgi:hypothetical protein
MTDDVPAIAATLLLAAVGLAAMAFYLGGQP